MGRGQRRPPEHGRRKRFARNRWGRLGGGTADRTSESAWSVTSNTSMAGAGTLSMSSRHAANKTASSSSSPPTPSPPPFSYQQASYLLDLALRATPLGHQHRGGMRLIRRVTFGSVGSDLLIELGPDDLDELAGPSGPYPEPGSQGVSGYWLLVSRTMSGVLSPRLSQKCFRRAPNDCLLATLLRDVLVRVDLGLRSTGIRVRIDSWLRPLDIACDRRRTRGADRLQ